MEKITFTIGNCPTTNLKRSVVYNDLFKDSFKKEISINFTVNHYKTVQGENNSSTLELINSPYLQNYPTSIIINNFTMVDENGLTPTVNSDQAQIKPAFDYFYAKIYNGELSEKAFVESQFNLNKDSRIFNMI
jgi:hypothetical protein